MIVRKHCVSVRLGSRHSQLLLDAVRCFAGQPEGKTRRNRFADTFGHLSKTTIRTERLDRTGFPNGGARNSFWNSPGTSSNPKQSRWSDSKGTQSTVISEPVSFGKRTKPENRQRERVQRGKLLIECSRPEFNHFEGSEITSKRREDVPLVSRYWTNNKYKNEWFTIHPSQKGAPALYGSCDRFWEHLDEQVVKNLRNMGVSRPTVVQKKSIMTYASSDHMFIASETGSGKTIAFGAPLISDLITTPHKTALVVLPSTLLERQSSRMLAQMAQNTNVSVITGDNLTCAENSSNIIVSTPGKLVKWLKKMNCGNIGVIVIDEADMLLDDSFVSVFSDLLSLVKVRHSETNFGDQNDGARIIFSSATCEDELKTLTEGIVESTKLAFVQSSAIHQHLPNVKQKFIRVREMDKIELLKKLLAENLARQKNNQTLVFCKDVSTVQYVAKLLDSSGLENTVVNSRQSNLSELSDCDRILVGTDVVSRGIDLPRLQHVINYDFPRESMVSVLHRVGRVGRCSSIPNTSVTSFVRTETEVQLVNALELAVRLNQPVRGIVVNIPRGSDKTGNEAKN